MKGRVSAHGISISSDGPIDSYCSNRKGPQFSLRGNATVTLSFLGKIIDGVIIVDVMGTVRNAILLAI